MFYEKYYIKMLKKKPELYARYKRLMRIQKENLAFYSKSHMNYDYPSNFQYQDRDEAFEIS